MKKSKISSSAFVFVAISIFQSSTPVCGQSTPDPTLTTTPTAPASVTSAPDGNSTTTESPETTTDAWQDDFVQNTFFDCVYLFYVCTDRVSGGWPSNKNECTTIFDTCTTNLGIDLSYTSGPPRIEDRHLYFPQRLPQYLPQIVPLNPVQPIQRFQQVQPIQPIPQIQPVPQFQPFFFYNQFAG
jgi:hypothetical protein